MIVVTLGSYTFSDPKSPIFRDGTPLTFGWFYIFQYPRTGSSVFNKIKFIFILIRWNKFSTHSYLAYSTIVTFRSFVFPTQSTFFSRDGTRLSFDSDSTFSVSPHTKLHFRWNQFYLHIISTSMIVVKLRSYLFSDPKSLFFVMVHTPSSLD